MPNHCDKKAYKAKKWTFNVSFLQKNTLNLIFAF